MRAPILVVASGRQLAVLRGVGVHTEVVGLYLNPPDNTAVFSFDEKSSVQVPDRTQPGLPLAAEGGPRGDDDV